MPFSFKLDNLTSEEKVSWLVFKHLKISKITTLLVWKDKSFKDALLIKGALITPSHVYFYKPEECYDWSVWLQDMHPYHGQSFTWVWDVYKAHVGKFHSAPLIYFIIHNTVMCDKRLLHICTGLKDIEMAFRALKNVDNFYRDRLQNLSQKFKMFMVCWWDRTDHRMRSICGGQLFMYTRVLSTYVRKRCFFWRKTKPKEASELEAPTHIKT